MRTSKASRWLGRVKACPCVLCDALGRSQQYPTDAHHMRHGQGMAQRSSDFMTAALCKDCHQGAMGIHGDRTLLRIAKLEEIDLVAMTIERLAP